MATLDVDIAIAVGQTTLSLHLEGERGTIALAGPSGAGKSRALRALAGLLTPERGVVRVGGETWFDLSSGIDVPPERRHVGFVFQDHALFPHLTVRQNIAFARGMDPDELMSRLGIGHLAAAKPARLSGGESQRVAVARALARRPQLLLLDEPTAALDVATAALIRAELAALLDELAIPCVVVTHDFEEAAALARRIAVVADGRVLQIGTASELVTAPRGDFVARFTGANLLRGDARRTADGLTEVTLDSGEVVYSTDAGEGRVGLVVHPWDVTVGSAETSDSSLNHFEARVGRITVIGNKARVVIGPIAAEVTTASVERLGLREGGDAIASFKATATRIVALEPLRNRS